MISPLSLNIIRYNYRLGAYAGWSVTDSNGLSTFVESGTMNVGSGFGLSSTLHAVSAMAAKTAQINILALFITYTYLITILPLTINTPLEGLATR